MSWFSRRGAAVVALGALLAGCNGLNSTGGPGEHRFVRGEPAPDASGTDAEGHALKLSEFRGKVVMLSFWSAT